MHLDEKITLLRERFIHRTDVFAYHWWSETKNDGGYLPATENVPCPNEPPCTSRNCRHRPKRPLTRADVADHLEGRQTIGVYQIGDNDTVKWLCFDVDISGGKLAAAISREESLQRVRHHTRQFARLLQAYAIPFLVEWSGSRGYHLWVFFDEPAPAVEVYAVGRWLAEQLTPPEGIHVEVFPKQVGSHALGALVKLPLGVHRKTLKRSAFVGRDFAPLPDQWEALVGVSTLSRAELTELIEDYEVQPPPTIRLVLGERPEGDAFHTLPCFVKLMSEGCGDGMRDLAAFKLACYLRSRGLTAPLALAAMREWNTSNRPPLHDDALQSKLRSGYASSYPPFPCSETAFDSYCDPNCRFFEGKMRRREGAK